MTIVRSGTGAGRVFSHEDFREDYAPRAAVHEALPDFLLKLDAPGLTGARVASPASPAWVRLSGSRHSHEPDHASVDAAYAFDRYVAEAGLEVALGEDVAAFVSARRLWGSADVTSPTGGGEIGARGSGMAVGIAVEGPDALYARGRLALATYSLDLSSNTLDPLATGIDARVDSLHLEAGRRIALNEHVQLTPRVRIARSEMEVDGFTDLAGSQVSVGGVTRFTGRVGVVATTTRALAAPGAVLSLRGGTGPRAGAQWKDDERRRVRRDPRIPAARDPPPPRPWRDAPQRPPLRRSQGQDWRARVGRRGIRRASRSWLVVLRRA